MGICGGRCGYCGGPPQINQRVGNTVIPDKVAFVEHSPALITALTGITAIFAAPNSLPTGRE